MRKTRRPASMPGLLLATILVFCPAPALAAQAVLSDDGYVSSTARKVNYGGGHTLVVDKNSTAYIQFDLSTLAAGITGADITKATLVLYVSGCEPTSKKKKKGSGQASPGNLSVLRVTSAWNERAVTYNTAATLDPTEIAEITIGPESANEFIAVDLTGLVKDWIDGVVPNHGVALVSDGTLDVWFDSKESDHYPRLEIAQSSGATGDVGPAGPAGPAGAAGATGP